MAVQQKQLLHSINNGCTVKNNGCTAATLLEVLKELLLVYRSTNGSEYFECRKCLQKNENFSIRNSAVKMGKNGKVSDFKLGIAVKNFL